MIRNLELTREMHEELIRYCNTRDIKFFSTGFDVGSINMLVELGINVFKIPSDPVEAAVANNTVTALTSIVAEKVEKTIGETAEGVEITDTLVENNLSEENATTIFL